MGTAAAVAIKVIISVDTKKGNTPKVGGSETGYHLVPNRNCHGEEWANIGSPSLMRTAMMPTRTIMANSPARNIHPSMNLSPNRSRRLRLSPVLEAATTVEDPGFNTFLSTSFFGNGRLSYCYPANG